MKKIPLVFLLCLLIFLMGSAGVTIDLNKYRLTVTSVDPSLHSFTLSNQMVCHIARNKCEKDALPEVGAEVRLAPKKQHEKYSLMEEGEFLAFFLREGRKKLCHIWMSPESKQSCLCYISSQKICLQPAGWITAAVYQDVIQLSDGSQWIVETSGELGLQEGDRVLLNPIDDERFWLIDIDRSTLVSGSQKTKFVRDNGVVVKLYLDDKSFD